MLYVWWPITLALNILCLPDYVLPSALVSSSGDMLVTQVLAVPYWSAVFNALFKHALSICLCLSDCACVQGAGSSSK